MALAFSTFFFIPRYDFSLCLAFNHFIAKRNETRRDGNGIMSLSMIRSSNVFLITIREARKNGSVGNVCTIEGSVKHTCDPNTGEQR